MFSVAREEWRKSSELRRSIAKASATVDEKDVILARISDLPAWVSVMGVALIDIMLLIIRTGMVDGWLADTIWPSVIRNVLIIY